MASGQPTPLSCPTLGSGRHL